MADSQTEPGILALVMAASRKGPADSVAQLQGLSHKCFVTIDGMVMLERVVGVLIETGRFDRIFVSIETEASLRTVPQLAAWMDEGKMAFVESSGNIADSILSAVNVIDNPLPLFITTGDNALHTAEIVSEFVDQFRAGSGDVAVSFTGRDVVLKEFPEPGLAFHELKDGGWSACNLYGLRNENALNAVKVFEGGGQFGKRHMRILKAFGIMPFILYKLKAVGVHALMARIGRGLGVTVDSIIQDYSWGPIDVDNPASFKLTEDALIRRRQAAEKQS